MDTMNGEQHKPLSYEHLLEILNELLVRVDQLEQDQSVPPALPALMNFLPRAGGIRPVNPVQPVQPSIPDQRNWFLTAQKLGIIPRTRTNENSWKYDQYAALRTKLGL